DGVDLALVGLGWVPAFPVDGGERAELGAAFAHPRDELLVGAPSRHAAVEDEVDVAVAAWPEYAIARAFDRASGHERAGARGLEAEEIDESGRVRQRGHHRRLGRDVDEIAAAGNVAVRERNQRADGGLRAGPAVG